MIHSWLSFFYSWPNGGVWGNVICVSVLAPLGCLWSRTKFWPIRPLRHALSDLHVKFEAEHQRNEEHRRWQYDVAEADRMKRPRPPHPHYD